ncbi:hypothetical protein DM02DRAFT_410004 [Periconia macrospinosa]|uniref:Uncharacterized protein n=1 Tax=Periconia macrospinosa TaxID=97972 RepID=A0A2V1DRZ9_9PLEO|nr:hypothetical protein DM02DRAFT_410004 [Periconia macrospinosa]
MSGSVKCVCRCDMLGVSILVRHGTTWQTTCKTTPSDERRRERSCSHLCTCNTLPVLLIYTTQVMVAGKLLLVGQSRPGGLVPRTRLFRVHPSHCTVTSQFPFSSTHRNTNPFNHSTWDSPPLLLPTLRLPAYVHLLQQKILLLGPPGSPPHT